MFPGRSGNESPAPPETIMKLLVTGTDGYIGVLLAAVLGQRGHEVTGLDTGFYLDGLLYKGGRLPMRRIQKDIRQITPDDLRGYDAVVHLAELSNDPLGQHNPELTFEINHLGSVALAPVSYTHLRAHETVL